MRYTIADIHIDLPDTLVGGHFARALRPFAAGFYADAPIAAAHLLNTTTVAAAHPADTDSLTPGSAADANSVTSGLTADAAPVATSGDADLVLTCSAGITRLPDYRELHRFDFTDADADCRFGCDAAGYLLEMVPRSGGAPARYRMARNSAQAVTDSTPGHNAALFRFGLWIVYNIAALRREAVAIHSSVIRYRDRGVLFLGESGTGKSTHTRLWREHIPGATLLNDDSPIVGIVEGEARVFGSPWSGKTPCYLRENYPIAAIVRLSQAPHNRIRRLRPIEAIGALLPSAPPAFVPDESLSDGVCTLLSQVIAQVPVYRLECLPDADAARLSCKTIFGE